MEFMVSLPAYYACLALETTGITHFTWVLTDISCRLGIHNMVDEGKTKTNNNNNGSEGDVRMEGAV